MFDFKFDDAFGFDSRKTRPTLLRALAKYAMFAELDEPTDRLVNGQLIGASQKAAKQRHLNVVASKGKATEQYPAPEDRGK